MKMHDPAGGETEKMGDITCVGLFSVTPYMTDVAPTVNNCISLNIFFLSLHTQGQKHDWHDLQALCHVFPFTTLTSCSVLIYLLVENICIHSVCVHPSKRRQVITVDQR